MVNYTWEIRTLETILDKDGLSRVIFAVRWALTGEAEGFSSTVEGCEYLKSPDPNSFVAYKELTEENVISWVETSMGDRLNDVKRDIEIELLRYQGKVVNLSKPWLLDPDLAPGH